MPSMLELWSKHRLSFTKAVVNDKEVVILGEHVLIDKVHPSLLGSGADFLAVLHEACILIYTSATLPVGWVSVPSCPLGPGAPHLEDHGAPQYVNSKSDQSEDSCGTRSSDSGETSCNGYRSHHMWRK